ncbi:MAG: Smr/MutS family protein [Clostridia bacterium]|nr:Smr/MutS family protein [Clostridia bacterium]
MSNYTEINIKFGMPRVVDAMEDLKSSLERCRKNKFKCVLIIHGYGSTGKGGAIQKKARQWLLAQKRNGKLKAVEFGENFSIFNFNALELKNRYKELETLMEVHNEGVTVVEF